MPGTVRNLFTQMQICVFFPDVRWEYHGVNYNSQVECTTPIIFSYTKYYLIQVPHMNSS